MSGGDQKLILTLINRIGVRLPYNSGRKLESLEADPLVQQTVAALIDLSEFRLNQIANNLVALLENVSKSSSMVLEDFVPFDVLQSQLFILKMLSACMTNHWKRYRAEKESPRRSSSSRIKEGNVTSVGDDTSSVNSNGNGNSHANSTSLRNLEDPPPLDEQLAKYILVVLTRFLQQMATQEESQNAPSVPGRTEVAAAPVDPVNAASAEIILNIYRAASRVLFYTSASNWNIVFTRIKARISYLTTTPDEFPETAELKLLETSALNCKRLSMVLEELRPSFIHLKKSSQPQMAIVLRKSIWNWIENYPYEFVALCKSQSRMNGGPEFLFDICTNIVGENQKRKQVFWPLQTMLLILCPDILMSASMSEGSRGSKKSMFLDNLKKSLRNKHADVAAVCYVDFCKASTYIPRNEQSALRDIVPEIETELRKKLFDPVQPFYNSDNVIDQNLMTDCLVALFRLNPKNALTYIVNDCLDERAPMAFKLVLVKSCLVIASEEQRLPWNPSISYMYSTLSSPLRRIFQENLVRDKVENPTFMAASPNAAPKKIIKSDKTRKIAQEEATEKLEIVLCILRLYKADPLLAVFSDSPGHFDENRTMMNGITACLHDPNPLIRNTAAECLLVLHDSVYIPRWGAEETNMETFWSISSNVMLAVARQILDTKEKEEGTKNLLDLLRKLLFLRNEFLEMNSDNASRGSDIQERLNSSIALEIALLVLLCSADTDICSAALICFGHLCTEAQLTEETEDPQHSPLTIVENMTVYLELSTFTGMVAGRKAQQKRIRKLLRLMNRPTPGNLAAWEEAWKRWKVLTQAVARPAEDFREDLEPKRGLLKPKVPTPNPGRGEVDEEKSSEWQNYTGFLAALGGCCLTSPSAPSTPTSSSGRSRTSSMHDYNFPHRRVSAPHDPNSMVDKFVQEMVELLVSENILVREVVKETLGAELSPGLYAILFRHLENVVSRFFGEDNEAVCNDRYTLFVEQAISVLRLVLDRIVDPSDNLFAVDFGSLALSFARYLKKLGNDHVALRIKVKMCQLIEVLMTKKECVTLRQEIKLRNKLLEITVEWTSDYSLKSDPTMSPIFSATQNEKLHRDLDQACLKTIVALLAQLPLQPEVVFEGDMATARGHPDMAAARSHLFYKYFNFFIKLLNRCRIGEAMEANNLSKTGNPDYQVLMKSKEALKDLGPLKEATILALSNLLSANVDSGLKFSLSMGYHDDHKTRTAYMQVLTNILKQGTEFNQLAENVMADRYDKLVDLVVEPDLNIAKSLCGVCPVSAVDDVSAVLLRTFESRNQSMHLLRAVIEHEVSSTVNEYELFRRNSMATRLLSVFVKTNGTEYLRSTLQPLMQNLYARDPYELTFELDPSKIDQNEDYAKNLANVKNLCQSFLDVICASTNNVPRSFREVCYHLANAVGERFPEAKYTAVGGFIFLRFFCPAIVSPDTDLLLKQQPTKEIRRGLLLNTKVIQNLANNVLFGAKESFMIVLNDFLTNNIYKVTTFLRDVSVNAPVPDPDPPAPVRLDDADYAKLHRYLYDNLERINRDFSARKPKTPQESEGLQAAKRSLEKLATLLGQLGRPADMPEKALSIHSNYTIGNSNQLFAEFMKRNSHRNTETIVAKKLFYEGSQSRAQRPVFYFITRAVVIDNADLELLIYHILQTLEPSMAKPYELLIDLTQFGPANEIPNQWLNQFFQMLPYDAVENLTVLYLYNANTNLKRYIKKMSRPITQKLCKRMVFACSVAELHEHISPGELRLPSATVALENEIVATFSQVIRHTPYRTSHLINIKISNEYIQITTAKKQEIFNGLTSVMNDVYHISNIDEVTVSHGRNDDNEFIIKHDRGKSVISFSSTKRENIIASIRQAKARFQLAKPADITERIIRPGDVPGTLLNMALLNIGSEDPNLRLAAYNLLYALSLNFSFDVGNQLLDAKDLCIPANNTDFVISISERLAMTEPHLTLEFLSECFVGINHSNPASKHLCLEYMAPWLSNLAYFTRPMPDDLSAQNVGRLKDVIRLLIDMTVTQNVSMNTSVQSKIWSTVSKVDDVIDLVLDAFVKYAVEKGIGSEESEMIADTMVTLSSRTVRGKLIARLRKVISKTSLTPKKSLTDHPAWEEIAILIRFNLMLSFNDRSEKRTIFLPELFHIISLLAATGPTLIRASIHALIVNIIQSLCTSMPSLDEDNLKKLQYLLTEFSEPRFKLLFGLTRGAGNAFSISQETTSDIAEVMPLNSLDTIVQALLEAMSCGAPSIDAANVWRARWMGLVTSTAFHYNPAIQPRAFVVLGCLAKEEVDDDLLYQILVALRGALTIFNESDCNLIISIIMCLTKIVETLSSESRYLQQLFWLAMALVQIGNVTTFPPAVTLLQAVLRALDSNGFFSDDPMVDVLLAGRRSLADVAAKIDATCGVNFEKHFSFAVAGVLMKGLKQPTTKSVTSTALQAFLEIECKGSMELSHVDSKMLGYLAALLPIAAKGGSLRELLRIAGIVNVDVDNGELATTYYKVFDKLYIRDNDTALLLVSLLVTMLNTAENEPERLFLYGILAEAAETIPEVFALVYDTLRPKMNQIVASSQTLPIIDAVKSILFTACSHPAFNQNKGRRTQEAILKELDFAGLANAGTFGNFSKKQTEANARLASDLVNLIIQ